jgi:hypothetical protein
MDLDRILKPEEIIDRLKYAESQYVKGYYYILIRPDVRDRIVELLKKQEEQGCAKIKEPDCRICGQSHCKYYHESQKPTECKSYIRMEGR